MDIHSFLRNEIQKLYDTEKQLADGLSFLAGKARSEDLRTTLLDHRQETMGHISRLEQVCSSMGWMPESQTDPVTRALVQEAEQMFQNAPMSSITDACIIATTQKAEHYEMACYGTVLALADEMDQKEITKVLSDTLDEEKKADKKLTKLAERGINEEAVESSGRASVR